MLDFEVINPTRIVFGKDQWHRLPELLSELSPTKRIMLAFGGGSIKQNGIYEKVHQLLHEFHVVDFGGIEANPEFSTLMKGVQLANDEKIDFILAVGGGSVIDGVKFMCGAFYYPSDPWEVLLRKENCTFQRALPFGTILTLPATGSEANSGAVISRSELKEKRTMGGPLFFPRFSLCDPIAVASLPKRQIANGIVDAYVHTLEQYITFPSGNFLQERQAEAILSTLIDIGPKVLEQPDNYTLAANLMWCATHALNGNLRCGVPTDWSTHMIAHELTAFYGIDHARTLAIILPRLYQNQLENKLEKLVQYGERVWKISGTKADVAKGAIEQTEKFFQQLGMDTRISMYTTDYEHLADSIRLRFEERGWTAMGERQAITPNDVHNIIQESL